MANISIRSISPSSGDTGVPIDAAIMVTFDSATNIDPATVTSDTFRVFEGDSETPLAGSLACTGKIVTFTPTENLVPGAIYHVQIPTEVLA